MIKVNKVLLFVLTFLFIFSSLVMAEQFQGPVPDKFNQAPMLDKLVEQGKLPSVEERLPESEDVYVVQPNEKVGQYGGTIVTTTLQANGYGDDTFLMSWPAPIKPTADGKGFVPHIIKKLDISDDKTTYTFHLRKGLKWSDGYPFTADDIMFWYNDVLLNKDLTAAIGEPWKSNGKIVKVKKIDKYTVEFKFATPRPYFKNRLVHMGAWDVFLPKHYLKQFHPKYTSPEKLKKMAKENGFDYWYQYFNDRNDNVWGTSNNLERPTLSSYVLVKRTSNRRIFERNPYYWKVDTEGNQLPYIDRIETRIVSDPEVVQGMIMSGEIDFAMAQTDIRNYPMYKQYETEGNFKTILWESGMGSDVIYMVNLTDKDPVLRKIFQDVRFRRALSLAINRKEINDSIYFGKGIPRQYTVLKSSPFYEPRFAKSYTDYDLPKAKELLKEMGLTDSDNDGILERPDGKDLTFTIEYVAIETPKQPNVELVKSYWKELGLNVKAKAISAELATQRAPANMMDSCLFHGDEAGLLFPVGNKFLMPNAPGWERTIWPAWGRWFSTEGKKGEEPPAQIKHLRSLWEQLLSEPDNDKRIELGKKILQLQADNLYAIGTVGKTPYPVVINKDLSNFPKHGYGVWDTMWTMTRDPGQLFYEKE